MSPRIRLRRSKVGARARHRADRLIREENRRVVRELVASLAKAIGLPRGVPSAPGQPGHLAWRRTREGFLRHQIDLLAAEAREQL